MEFHSVSPPERPRAPATWWWYVLLCVGLAMLNVGLFLMGMYFLPGDAEFVRQYDLPEGTFSQQALMWVVFGFVFAIGNLILPFLPKKPWSYVLHMTNIIAGGLTCVCLPVALPLFFAWLKQDIKDYFEFR